MRIFVFRPRSDAERSARKLAARGHEAVVAPLFDVKPSQEPAPEGAFDAIVLTSGNAVPALASAPDAWRRLPVFTVGARTAARVREAGLPDARSADGGRDELIALIGDNLGPPARLLLIVGRDRHDDVGARLAAAGFSTTIWTAYAAEAVEVLPETAAAALRDRNVEAALHYSPRGAQVFLDLVQGAGLREPALELTHVALSAEVAAPLVAAGASTILVAEHPEEAALMAALDQVLARKTGADDAREGAVAPVGGDAGEDAMKAPKTSGSETNAGDPSGADATAPARGRARRTPPTIEGKGFERKAFERKAVEGEAVEGKASAGGVISGEAAATSVMMLSGTGGGFARRRGDRGRGDPPDGGLAAGVRGAARRRRAPGRRGCAAARRRTRRNGRPAACPGPVVAAGHAPGRPDRRRRRRGPGHARAEPRKA